MYFKNVIFVAKTCKYGIFVAKIGKYGIFVAKIYKYALIDRFQGSAGFLDSAANCAALASCISISCWLFSLLQCIRHSSGVINLYHQILTFHPKTKHYWARCAKNMNMPALLLPPSTTLYYISLYLEWEI